MGIYLVLMRCFGAPVGGGGARRFDTMYVCRGIGGSHSGCGFEDVRVWICRCARCIGKITTDVCMYVRM